MAEKRNLCAQIPLPLFNRVGEERERAGQTNSEFITNLLTEYFEMKKNGGTNMEKGKNKGRTLAFQISEDLFERIKAHLDRESERLGHKYTQRDFVIGLIEAALAKAEGEASTGQNTTSEATAEDASETTGEETAENASETTSEATAEDTSETTGEATAEDASETTGEETAEDASETTDEATAENASETTNTDDSGECGEADTGWNSGNV